MPTVFLSHTHCDKPFVERLASDLKHMGVNVWYDSWEIKVGESLTWRIEQGIGESRYLAVVLSPEALASEWVRRELGAGLAKQAADRRVSLLPIRYRACDIPWLLRDRRYADFTTDYEDGLAQLAQALGLQASAPLSSANWRRFAQKRIAGWQAYRDQEFRALVNNLVSLATSYNWSLRTGASRLPHSLILHDDFSTGRRTFLAMRLDGRTHGYHATLTREINPCNLRASEYASYVGCTVNECAEYVWRHLEAQRALYGDPERPSIIDTYRFLNKRTRGPAMADIVKTIESHTEWADSEIT